jgi:hypothetical protein
LKGKKKLNRGSDKSLISINKNIHAAVIRYYHFNIKLLARKLFNYFFTIILLLIIYTNQFAIINLRINEMANRIIDKLLVFLN